jgi:Dam-replacing HTH domain
VNTPRLARTSVSVKSEFTTAESYAFTRALEKLHPDNRHVRDKIRQQLQVGFLFARICVCRLTQMPDAKRLRDAGLLLHVGRGVWRWP